MRGRDNIINFGGGMMSSGSTRLDVRTQRIADDCRQLVSSSLSKLMEGLFEQLDDSLYQLADKAEGDTLRVSYFDAMRLLRKDRLRIQEAYIEHILTAYESYWESGAVDAVRPSLDQLSRESEMALIAEDEFEDSLAITNMISKCENRFSNERYAIGRRFSHLMGNRLRGSPEDQKSPLEPAVICNAFQAALKNTALDLPVRLVVYKLFEKHVLQHLGRFYEEVSRLFSNAGVNPGLAPKVRRNPQAPVKRGSGPRGGNPSSYMHSQIQGGTQSSGYVAGDSEVSGGHAEVFATLQQLLNVNRALGGRGTVDEVSLMSPGIQAGSYSLVDTGELMGALSALQHSNMMLAAENRGELVRLDAKQLRHQLIQDLHMKEGSGLVRALGDADNDTIDVISMLFEYILEDYSLPDAMKALISRLQIPVLKLAIIDKTFFSRKVHPARRLLNSLAQAAVGWTDAGDRENDTLYMKIESVVKRILNEFHDDPSIFEQLDDEFTHWWEQEQRGADVAEQRTNQVTRGKEQLQGAKQIVLSELNRRLQSISSVPEAVMELLEDGWKDVLLLNYLRQGADSEEWKKSLEIVDRLLWSVQPKSDYAERQELLRNIPELLRNTRERLNSISYDQHKMSRLFKELQNCHIGCLRGSDAASMKGQGTAPAQVRKVSFPDSQLLSGASSLLDEQQEEQESVPDDKYTRDAENFEVGGWLEIADGDRTNRVKLSWRSNITDAYIFVNRKGMKALELTRQGLAKHLREGTARRVEVYQAPLMDRALDAMLDALKKTDPKPAI
jgi:hypothetical protein